jgi:hypothetical protein
MKTMKAKTPEELAAKSEGKDKFTLYLDVQIMKYIKHRAAKAGTSASEVVNEAITAYVIAIKDRKSD